ncbi:MAG: zinc ribbon domain-containing protein, partial [Chloroflexi bacterium]|nr:zinc ribbon domain-containing protein [Chloroflexota bacterium]
MQCPSCHGDNPDEAKFCMSCATPLKRVCPSCSAESP